MVEGYAMGMDGTRFPITVGRAYGVGSKNYANEEWVDYIKYTKYVDVWEIIPHEGNVGYLNTIYIEGTKDNPIRLKSLVLPSGTKELVTNNVTVEDGLTIQEDCELLELNYRIHINNLEDFVHRDDVEIAIYHL